MDLRAQASWPAMSPQILHLVLLTNFAIDASAGIGLRCWAWPGCPLGGYKEQKKYRPLDLEPVEGSGKWALWTHC